MFLDYVEYEELVFLRRERHAAAEVDGPDEDGRRRGQPKQPDDTEHWEPHHRRGRHRH